MAAGVNYETTADRDNRITRFVLYDGAAQRDAYRRAHAHAEPSGDADGDLHRAGGVTNIYPDNDPFTCPV